LSELTHGERVKEEKKRLLAPTLKHTLNTHAHFTSKAYEAPQCKKKKNTKHLTRSHFQQLAIFLKFHFHFSCGSDKKQKSYRAKKRLCVLQQLLKCLLAL
jgi:hypothetical protein